MSTWKIFSASASGSWHQSRNTPNQDAHQVVSLPNACLGFLADGCGSGKFSQVGAQLGVRFLSRHTTKLLQKGYPHDFIHSRLFTDLAEYLAALARLQNHDSQSLLDFVGDYLLFTVMGIIANSTSVSLFTCGDGILAFDDHLIYLDQDNRPDYLAYLSVKDLLPDDSNIPQSFDFWQLKPDTINQIVLASDAFLKQPDLLLAIPARLKSDTHLQMMLNRINIVDQLLDDDATLVVVQKQED